MAPLLLMGCRNFSEEIAVNFLSFVRALAVNATLLISAGAASAATCTATSIYTNPDATLTNAASCGVGILNDNNDSEADLNSLAVGGFTNWVSLAKVDAGGGSSTDGVLSTTGTNPAGSSGDWGFDATPTYNSYVLVIKDGGAPGGNADSIFWAWFIVDLTAGCSLGSFSGQDDYCGTWEMYGDPDNTNGSRKQISHLSLYGSVSGSTSGGGTTGGGTTGGGTTGGGSTGGGNVPEPGSIALTLLGLGLLGSGFAMRRRREAV